MRLRPDGVVALFTVLPSWVHGRGLAIYQLTFQAGYVANGAPVRTTSSDPF
jgi:hypothetical protein